MKFTKQRAAYLGLLGLGLAALLVDRALLAPSGASAASTSEYALSPSSPASSEPAAADPSPAPSTPGALAQKLRGYGPEWSPLKRDAFVPTHAWVPPPPPEVVEQPLLDEIEAFVSSHPLTAVQGHGTGRAVVVVRGTVKKIGDEIDGWTLAEVHQFSALFTRGDLKARLVLSQGKEVAGNVLRNDGKPADPPHPGDPGKP